VQAIESHRVHLRKPDVLWGFFWIFIQFHCVQCLFSMYHGQEFFYDWILMGSQQADLSLPVLLLSRRIECDCIFYSLLLADTHKNSPYCVLYSDGDVEW